MAPPQYPDLGKCARDIINNGYHFGQYKLNIKSKTNSGVEFSAGGLGNHATGAVSGSLETKYRFKDYGLTFSEKWVTDNILSTEFAVTDYLAKGLKVSADTTFAPQTSDKSARLKTSYAHDCVALNCDLDLISNSPSLLSSAVVGYNGWLAGYQMRFDTQNTKIVGNNISVGFAASDFTVTTNVNDGKEFNASVYQKISPKLESAAQISWTLGSEETRFGVAGKYTLDADSALRAKINNQSQIGVGYQQRLRPGITLFLSALIDAKNFNDGGHKVGLSLELEA